MKGRIYPLVRFFASRSRASVSPSAGGVVGAAAEEQAPAAAGAGAAAFDATGGGGGATGEGGGVGAVAGRVVGAAALVGGVASGVATAPSTGRSAAWRRIADRAPEEPARPRAANRSSVCWVRRDTRRPRTRSETQAPPVRELAPPERHPPQRDVERPQQQREDQQQRPQVGEAARGLEVVDPRVGGEGELATAGRGAQRREQRLVRAEQPVLGRRSARRARPSARAATSPAASG